MQGFDKTTREAELHAERENETNIEVKTMYRPDRCLTDEPTDFTRIEVEFRDGKPQTCYCGFYEDPNPNANKIESCLMCRQGDLFG